MFKQEVPSIGLSVESETERVPRDGRFYVLQDGAVTDSFTSKAQALKAYRQLRDKLLEAASTETRSQRVREALQREIQDAQFRDFRGETGRPRTKLRVGGRRGHR